MQREGEGAPYLVEPRRIQEGVSSETRPERQQQNKVSIQNEQSKSLVSSHLVEQRQDEARARGRPTSRLALAYLKGVL